MYRLYSFDGVTLPDARSEFDGDTAQAWLGAVALPGGALAFDSLGSGRAPLVAPYVLEYSSVVSAASLGSLESTLSTWRGKVGTRGLLRRRLLSAATYQDITARLVEITMPVRPAATHGKQLKLIWRFQVLEESWRASSATTSSNTLGASPKTIALGNSGNAVVRDMVVTITPKTADITALTVAISGTAEWTFSGTIVMNKSLVVDCGARTVRNDGVDAYSSFALTANHKSSDWLPLAPGLSSVVVTKTGGSTDGNALFSYYFRYV